MHPACALAAKSYQGSHGSETYPAARAWTSILQESLTPLPITTQIMQQQGPANVRCQRLDQLCHGVRTKLESARDSKCLPHPPTLHISPMRNMQAMHAAATWTSSLRASPFSHEWPVRAVDRRLLIASRRERPRIRYEYEPGSTALYS